MEPAAIKISNGIKSGHYGRRPYRIHATGRPQRLILLALAAILILGACSREETPLKVAEVTVVVASVPVLTFKATSIRRSEPAGLVTSCVAVTVLVPVFVLSAR